MTHSEIAAIIITGLLVLFDYVTGLAKAFANKEISSEKMRHGLWHKAAYVGVIALAEIIEHGQGHVDLGYTLPVVIPTCVYIIITETASILENLAAINPELADSPILRLFHSDKDADGEA